MANILKNIYTDVRTSVVKDNDFATHLEPLHLRAFCIFLIKVISAASCANAIFFKINFQRYTNSALRMSIQGDHNNMLKC